MSKKHERDLQSKCIEYLNGRGIYFLNLFGDSYTSRGKPDLIVCINGRFVAFELKVGSNDLEDAQIIHKRKIERSKGLHFSPYTFTEFVEIVEELYERF